MYIVPAIVRNDDVEDACDGIGYRENVPCYFDSEMKFLVNSRRKSRGKKNRSPTATKRRNFRLIVPNKPNSSCCALFQMDVTIEDKFKFAHISR
jgi:hypothetical protein